MTWIRFSRPRRRTAVSTQEQRDQWYAEGRRMYHSDKSSRECLEGTTEESLHRLAGYTDAVRGATTRHHWLNREHRDTEALTRYREEISRRPTDGQ